MADTKCEAVCEIANDWKEKEKKNESVVFFCSPEHSRRSDTGRGIESIHSFPRDLTRILFRPGPVNSVVGHRLESEVDFARRRFRGPDSVSAEIDNVIVAATPLAFGEEAQRENAGSWPATAEKKKEKKKLPKRSDLSRLPSRRSHEVLVEQGVACFVDIVEWRNTSSQVHDQLLGEADRFINSLGLMASRRR